MSELADDPAGQSGGGDLYGKTLALLRRLFVGNGYKLEQIQLKQLSTGESALHGRVLLELEATETTEKVLGQPRGGHFRTFLSRSEQASYLAGYRQNLANENWVDDVIKQIATTPLNGWAMESTRFPLPRLTQKVALQLNCDICLGRRTQDCETCYNQREITCPSCGGAGQDRADYTRPCPQCQGRRRVMCQICRGTGQIECRTCLGHGVNTEETLISASAQARFEVGALESAPPEVDALIDRIGVEHLADGHALIIPNAKANSAGGPVYHLMARIQFGKFQAQLGEQHQQVIAIGMKPVLADFPFLLDEPMSKVTEQLSAVSLPSLMRKYRLVRELAEALARSIKPGRFFSHKYPFGLSPECAFALAAQLRTVLSSASLVQRALVAGIGALVAVAIFYGWRTSGQALPASLPPMLADLGLLLLLSISVWLATALMGRQAIQAIVPIAVRLRTAGGQIALAGAGLTALLCALLLYLPATRPDWLAQVLT